MATLLGADWSLESHNARRINANKTSCDKPELGTSRRISRKSPVARTDAGLVAIQGERDALSEARPGYGSSEVAREWVAL